MAKGIAKYGFLSGVLPRPRAVVPRALADFEKNALAKVKTGFADPKMCPRGSPANPPGRKQPEVSFKLAKSARAPTNPKTATTPHQEFKALSATIRRKYMGEALHNAERREKRAAERRQSLHVRAQQLKNESLKAEDSIATKLTMPTIEKALLAGAMVRPRTPAETEALALKRRANRLKTLANQVDRRDSTLMELYQQTPEFILTVEELNEHIDNKFFDARGPSTAIPALKQTEKKIASARKWKEQLRETLMGQTSTKGRPGLDQVRSVLK